MAQFYQGGGEPAESIELGQSSSSSVVTRQPTGEPVAQVVEKPESTPTYYFAVQLTHNLITRLVVTNCQNLTDAMKTPLRNNAHDIIFYEEPGAYDDGEEPDLFDTGPEVPIDQLDADFFARILRHQLLTGHAQAVPRQNIVITYPGPYHRDRETGLLRTIRGLNFFKEVYCLPESHMFHELFFSGHTAAEHRGEVLCVLYGDQEDCWFAARQQDMVYIPGTPNRPLCSAWDLVTTAIQIFKEMNVHEDTGATLRKLLDEFLAPVFEYFQVANVADLDLQVAVEKKRTAEFATRMDLNCLIARKAFTRLRGNIFKMLHETFGKDQPCDIRIVCCGVFLSKRYENFRFYPEDENLYVKWQKNESKSIDAIASAATCLAALHDGLDLLKLEATDGVMRPIHRTDLSHQLSAPIPQTNEVEL